MSSSSLVPYQMWSTVLSKVTDRDTMEVRFALLARGFVDSDYDKCKIPTHLSRVSKSVNKHLARLTWYPSLSVPERLDVLTDLRAFNDADHVKTVLEATRFFVDCFEYDTIRKAVANDIKAVRAVDLTRAPQLARAAGMTVKDYVTHLRVEALSV